MSYQVIEFKMYALFTITQTSLCFRYDAFQYLILIIDPLGILNCFVKNAFDLLRNCYQITSLWFGVIFPLLISL